MKKEILNKLKINLYVSTVINKFSFQQDSYIRESNEKEQSDITHYERVRDWTISSSNKQTSLHIVNWSDY